MIKKIKIKSLLLAFFFLMATIIPMGTFGTENAQAASKTKYFMLTCLIRKYTIEYTRTTHWGNDESQYITVANLQSYSDMVRNAWPGAKITWALSWCALTDTSQNYIDIRNKVKSFHDQYGDEVTFAPGTYFPNMQNTRAQVNQDIHDALNVIAGFMNGYRPKSLVCGDLASDNIEYARNSEGIIGVQGNIFSQFNIDAQDSDGSIPYPYYPSAQHFLKPAQSSTDFIDCLNFDGWTVDFTCARLNGFQGGNSRLGVGPIETYSNLGWEVGTNEARRTAAVHYMEDGNPFGFITVDAELILFPTSNLWQPFGNWLSWVHQTYPDAKAMSVGDLAAELKGVYPNNDNLSYKFDQIGNAIQGSRIDQEVCWIANKSFRLGLLKQAGPVGYTWCADEGGTYTFSQPTDIAYGANGNYVYKTGVTGTVTFNNTLFGSDPAPGIQKLGFFKNGNSDSSSDFIMDFTDYTKNYSEPQDLNNRAWSLLGDKNQKRTRPQDNLELVSSYSNWQNIYARLSSSEKSYVDNFLAKRLRLVNDDATGAGNNQFEYSGSWSAGGTGTCFQGDNHWSNTANSYYTMRFNGTQVSLFTAKDPGFGIAGISIDGGAETMVDLYAAGRYDIAKVYTSSLLDNGNHVMKVRVTGTKNASSSNYFISADAVQISNNTGNKAFNKTVTASSAINDSNWKTTSAVDGQRSSVAGGMGWTSNNSTSTNHTEWIQVDLGSASSISKVDLYPRNDSTNTGYGFPVDFTIQVSTDNTGWTTVVTRTAYALPAGTAQSFEFNAINARYVKINGTSLRQNPNDGNLYRMQFAELEVFK